MRVDTISESAIRPAAASVSDEPAGTLRARIGGYVVDMVILAAVAMLLVVVAGSMLLLVTDGAEQDPTAAELYTFVAIIGLGTPLAWTLLNVALLATRGQTGGQYVAGLRLARPDGGGISLRTTLAWWFCFNPLLFNWPMAIIGGVPLAALLALALSVVSLFLLVLVVLVCIAAPVVALVSALVDGQNRALHDRVVRVIAVSATER